MSARLLTVTAQGAALAAASNTLAQGFTIYRDQTLSAFDPVTLLHFVLYSVISTPPNYKWQLWLEDNFPSNPKKDVAAPEKKSDDAKGEEKQTLSVTNTIAKFVLDQSIGAAFNTLLFITMINLFRGAGYDKIMTAVRRDFWTMMIAGYKFWPLVSILNLSVVPVEQRMLVGGLAGLAWGIYVSLMGL
ncbi:hypothetical protein PV05_06570 [Exophiala xenobiotica]|uniref:Uncharacterized protein n=1 Tax=Exophiala xenobiotica TaxID=348802 RepID=A0A0D2EFG9_9EURO|nr:uncharacterized protein PV05_06570 [Exophiala xenobiotica]KIW54193.1 hypothetical protein PV05_06570 [Exophiala xenobiotica]